MRAAQPIFSKSTFQFFRDLARNNHTEWMNENRDRYKASIVQPCRRFLEELSPGVLELNETFDVTGRTGPNFSRINRDIRFAKDKTPYKAQMYVKFPLPDVGGRESGEFYVGLSTDAVTAGFRIYAGGKRKDSVLATIAEPRVTANPKWLAQQKRRLSRKYDSYWYTTEKGQWTKHEGWPSDPANWKRLLAWVVRNKMAPARATQTNFPKEVLKIFCDLYPLVKFTGIPDELFLSHILRPKER
jgi:uncharacterized protein (TIGR02453 family)